MTKLKYIFLLPIACLSISAMAQDEASIERARKARADSVTKIERMRADNLSDLKSERDETKLKAEKAQKVERNANDAARQSNDAYRSEQKAQKARNKADKQARKAAKARIKSDN